MEVCMSNTLVPTPSITTKNLHLIRHSFSSSRTQQQQNQRNPKLMMIVEAKGKRGGGGMQARQFQRPMPALPKIEDDGNPRFVIFIRMANVSLQLFGGKFVSLIDELNK